MVRKMRKKGQTVFADQISKILVHLDKGLNLQDSSSKMMISLAGDLLDFSQLKNGKFRKNESMFDVKQCIEDVVLIQQFKAQKLKIEVSCDF